MSRPEALFPLFADLTGLPGVGEKTAKQFKGVGVEAPRDLLLLLPHAVIDRRRVSSVMDIEPPTTATIEVVVGRHRPSARRGGPYRVDVQDERTTFQLVFFRAHGDYLQKQLPTGQRRIVSGKVELFDGVAQIVHPDHILAPEDAAQIPDFEPVYPLAQGLSQRVVAKAAQAALDRVPDLGEWIDKGVMANEGWPTFRAALNAAHAPENLADVLPQAPARRRLAYDECLAHQLTLAIARAAQRKASGIESHETRALQQKVLDALPFKPTGAQERAVRDIAADMAAANA